MSEDVYDKIQELNQTVGELYNQGKYQAATSLAIETSDLVRKHLGENHPHFASSLNNLAALYDSMGSYARAEPLYILALEIRRKTLGEDHPDLAQSLNNLATLYYRTGSYAKAEPLFLQALEIRRKTLGEDHPNFANSLNNLAALYDSMGTYTKSEPLYRQALEIRRKTLGEDHPDLAQSLNNLATLYYRTGSYAKAEPLFLQALEIRQKTLGEDHPQLAISLNNLALLYDKIGSYAKSEPLYRQALEIQRKTLGENHPNFANSLNNLAVLYERMGHYAYAEPLYRQALEIRRKTLGEDHPDFAQSLNNLAGLHDSMGNYAKAELLYQQANEIWQKALGEDHPQLAINLNNLAELYSLMGSYAKAELLYRQALEIQCKTLGEEHPNCAIIIDNLANLYLSIGMYAKAEPLHRKAVAILIKTLGQEHFSFAQSLHNLAVLLTALDQVQDAFSLMELANDIQYKTITKIFSFASEAQRTAYLSLMRNTLNGFFSLVWEYLPDSSEAIRSAMNLALRRKAILAEAQATQRDAILGGRYPRLRTKLNELAIMRMQIAQKTLSGPGKEGLEEHQVILAEWESQRERIESELARQIPEMNLDEMIRQADCQSIGECLKDVSGILVEFVRYDVFDFKAVPSRGEKKWKHARYLGFVLATDEPDEVQMIDLGEAEHIDRLIAQFRTAIADDPSKETLGQIPSSIALTGEQLRKAIFDPIREFLGDHRHIIISPDGNLSRVAFEALPNGPGRFLIDDYKFSYVAVGRDVLRFNRESSAEPFPPVVVADPDFNLGGTPRKVDDPARERPGYLFSRLSKTKGEGKYLAEKFGVTPNWLGASALEKPLKAVKSPSVLHIATHGFFYEDQKIDLSEGNRSFRFDSIGGIERGVRFSISNLKNPLLRSGLALAGANTWLKGQDPPEEAEDGLLTAEDVTGMDLLDTELVVLSACDTGLGDVHIGEGVMGLRRSFMLAGAKTLVMSLWKVPDKETRELMEEFYDRLLEGAPRAEALRQAQLSMKAKHPNPYYWGAFICQGDPSPIEAFRRPK